MAIYSAMFSSGVRTEVRSSGFLVKRRFSQQQIPRKGKGFLQTSEEIRNAVASGKPVVALESTIYTHGFPYPENAALALRLESIVRENGGVPATIGVLNGIARVGFEREELIELAASAGKPDTKKLSRRDLGYICGLGLTNQKLNGGTTIAGTMVLAHLAGIKIFATGGLGGVHRGGENTMDISADLTELGRTAVTVISSGCKSFLDIPRTLEYMETQGVFVGTFADGRDGRLDFPAFWTRDSGISSPAIIRDEKQAAAIIYAQRSLSITSGMFFANPIPVEHSLEGTYMDGIIAQALRDASDSGSSGSDNTPFILRRIRELTGGSTVNANSALVEANVLRGVKVAAELEDLELQQGLIPEQDDGGISGSKKTTTTTHSFSRSSAVPLLVRNVESISASDSSLDAPLERPSCVDSSGDAISQQVLVQDGFEAYEAVTSMDPSTSLKTSTSSSRSQNLPSSISHIQTDIIVAGSLAIDLSCDYLPPVNSTGQDVPQRFTSNPAAITQTVGGVGHNVATAIHYLGTSVRLCSQVGDDLPGSAAVSQLTERGMQTTGITKRSGFPTAHYVAINDSRKNLMLAMADMSILERSQNRRGRIEIKTPDSSFVKWQAHMDACKPTWIIVDANWDPITILNWIGAENVVRAKIAFEPVSAVKSKRLFSFIKRYYTRDDLILVDLATPNLVELDSMHAVAKQKGWFDHHWRRWINAMGSLKISLEDGGASHQAIQLLPYIPTILTKMGDRGVLMTQMLRPGDSRLTSPESAPYILSRSETKDSMVGGVYMRLFPSVEKVPENEIISVNGVGDTFLGVLVAGLAKPSPKKVEDLIDIAQRGSVMTLKSKDSVSRHISELRSEL